MLLLPTSHWTGPRAVATEPGTPQMFLQILQAPRGSCVWGTEGAASCTCSSSPPVVVLGRSLGLSPDAFNPLLVLCPVTQAAPFPCRRGRLPPSIDNSLIGTQAPGQRSHRHSPMPGCKRRGWPPPPTALSGSASAPGSAGW